MTLQKLCICLLESCLLTSAKKLGWLPLVGDLSINAHMCRCAHMLVLLRPYGMNQSLPHSSKTVMHFPPFSVMCSWHDILYFEQLTKIVLCKWSLCCKLMCSPGYRASVFLLGLLQIFQ